MFSLNLKLLEGMNVFPVDLPSAQAAGKRLVFIMISFDNRSDGFTSGYRAYVGDFKIFSSKP